MGRVDFVVVDTDPSRSAVARLAGAGAGLVTEGADRDIAPHRPYQTMVIVYRI